MQRVICNSLAQGKIKRNHRNSFLVRYENLIAFELTDRGYALVQ